MATSRLVPLTSAGLATVTVALAILGLAELSRADDLGRHPCMLTLDVAEDGQARLALDKAKTAPEFTRAAGHARNAIAQSAYNNNARLRLVFLDAAQHGHLTPAGAELLAQSYDLAPYDALVAAWRVRFALEHWGDLEPSTRISVRKEALAFGRLRSRAADIPAALKSVHDERGRVVAGLWLRRLRLPAS